MARGKGGFHRGRAIQIFLQKQDEKKNGCGSAEGDDDQTGQAHAPARLCFRQAVPSAVLAILRTRRKGPFTPWTFGSVAIGRHWSRRGFGRLRLFFAATKGSLSAASLMHQT
jgi:hypothetical protein